MQIIPSALLLIAAIFILPESPRFLILKGDQLKARYVLSYVRHLSAEHEYINAEMNEIEEAIERQRRPSPRSSPGRFSLFRELWWKGNRNRVLIGLGLMFGQNLTGIQGMNLYTPTIFKTIGFEGTKDVLLASGLSLAFMFSENGTNVNSNVLSSKDYRYDFIPGLLHRPSRQEEITAGLFCWNVTGSMVHRWLRDSNTSRSYTTPSSYGSRLDSHRLRLYLRGPSTLPLLYSALLTASRHSSPLPGTVSSGFTAPRYSPLALRSSPSA